MKSLNTEEFERYYQAGKYAFECGKYRLSVEKLEEGIKFISSYSRLGGEAQMWLVNAYEADGKQKEAIALCEKLVKHPHPEIRQQSKNLLYILQAPKLKRPKEWMTEIPDFNSLSESKAEYRRNSNNNKSIKPKAQIETNDLSQVERKDNKFIWLGILLMLITLIGLSYF